MIAFARKKINKISPAVCSQSMRMKSGEEEEEEEKDESVTSLLLYSCSLIQLIEQT